MNAFWWSAAKPIACIAALVALVIVASRPGTRRALWSFRARLARPWNGTADDVFTPAGGDAWDETYWHYDEHGNPIDPLRDAPTREMPGEMDEDNEGWLYELGAHTWPRSEYMSIIHEHEHHPRRAARALRRRAGVPQ